LCRWLVVVRGGEGERREHSCSRVFLLWAGKERIKPRAQERRRGGEAPRNRGDSV
jgi:hypothetical protein